jgi:hypothetical protein
VPQGQALPSCPVSGEVSGAQIEFADGYRVATSRSGLR